MSVSTFDPSDAIAALAPDAVERAVEHSVNVARQNPYVAAGLTIIVAGYAIYRATAAAAPVIGTAYRHARIRFRRIRVAMATPLPDEPPTAF